METSEQRWQPDWAVPPGETLREVLDVRGMTQAELAERSTSTHSTKEKDDVTRTDDVCGYCREEVSPDYRPPNDAEQALLGGRRAHNECAIRGALGGIGHLEDHAYWCLHKGDPDAGLTYHASALQVMSWVREHGIEATS